MNCTARILVVLLAAVLSSGNARGVTVHVPVEQPTIQQGIDAASPGDTVLVAHGTYDGPLNRDLNFGGKNIVLMSDSISPLTVLSCQQLGRGFLFNSGEDTTAVVYGFAISHGVADTGAGAYCLNGSSPRFEQCWFDYCQAQSTGGALCAQASSPVLRGCTIWLCSAGGSDRQDGCGGGVACYSGSAPLIVDTWIALNDATGLGGGLYADESSPTLLGCEFDMNEVGDYGYGAGAKLNHCTGASFTGCVFSGNHTASSSATCVGGGLHATASTFDATDCDFTVNVCGASGGIHLTDGTTAHLSGCTFARNRGEWSAAGAIQCVLGSDVTISNCTFVENDWGHVWCDGTSPTLEDCILAFSDDGPPVYCETGGEAPHIHHCFVYGNAGGDSLCGGNFHDIEYVDPAFCGMPWNLTLCADSPCLPGATWPQLVGARGQGCEACGSGVEETSWGKIKARYK